MAVKVGCFRMTYKNGRESYLPYYEFYERDTRYKESLKAAVERGDVALSCACCDTEDLELTITKNHVIRVKTNRNQSSHVESCPKSEEYSSWASKNQNGLMQIQEDGRLCFRIAVPTGIKSEGGSSGSSSSSSRDGAKLKANVLDLIQRVNAYAWLKQTYSVRKKIKEAHMQNLPPQWEYKSFEDFMRLFFGVTADIDVFWQNTQLPLKEICYRSDVFFQADFRFKYLIYAQIEKLSEYKEDRKYQYITLRMRGYNSPNKATVRVLTDSIAQADFESLGDLIKENRRMIFSGYAKHDSFQNNDTGEMSHWITMINFVAVEASEHGLLLYHEHEKEVLDALCEKKIVFKRSLLPLENYGGSEPTAIIEQQNGKDIIIDICSSSQEYGKKVLLTTDNPEYDILLYKKNVNPQTVIDDLFALFKKRREGTIH